ncbi:MAG: hypothetical protein ABI231_03190 [Candidatus Tumulicola sp.]
MTPPMALLILCVAFIATNIDALVVLALLFAFDMPSKPRQAVASACASFAVVLAVSAAAAYTFHAVAPAWTRWLGLLLVGAGMVRAWAWFRSRNRSGISVGANVSIVAAVLATGGDNLVVYLGLFANMDAIAVALTSVAYLLAFGVSTYALLLVVAKGRLGRTRPLHWEPLTALALIVIGIAVTTKALWL